MIPFKGQSFQPIYDSLSRMLGESSPVEQDRWQGVDVKGKASARVYELRNVVLEVDLQGEESLDHWRKDIHPNLPWADDHFMERVSGEPLNPGVQWKNWPWGKSAEKFRNPDEIFQHTYMERLWPKYARMTPGGRTAGVGGLEARRGVAWEYGDLESLVQFLVKEPSTRQAWIPLFFPEDTGYGDGGRKPCTLGYQFLVRSGKIHIWYPLRSCDLVHHFLDDCYLAVRLLLWVLDQCRERDQDFWGEVIPGSYAMHCTSLHCFENDRAQLRRKYCVHNTNP